jgi:hypothetical protein
MNNATKKVSFSGAKNAPAGLVAIIDCPFGSCEINGSASQV